jgi:hypothetical protein
MLMTMRRVLSFPLSSALGGDGEGGSDSASIASYEYPKVKGKLPIGQIKQRMELVLQDIKGTNVERLQYRIRATSKVNDLWILRSDLYHVISMAHSQSEAVRRINGLLPSFSEWIASTQLRSI